MNIFYKNKQGNILENVEGANIECDCLEEVKTNTVDGASEKHVPVITEVGDKIKVNVGEVSHPMEEDHLIAFVEQVTEDMRKRVYLKPNTEPVAFFDNIDCTIYSYCNKHGMWKQEWKK